MVKFKLIGRVVLTLFTFGILTLSILNSDSEPSIWRLTFYSSLILIFAILLIYQIKNPKLLTFLVEAELKDNRFESFHLLSTPLIFIGLFIVVSKNLYLIEPDLFIIHKIPSTSDWVLFGLDQTIRSIALDFFETFKIYISNIDTDNRPIMGLIFAYKTLLSLTF